MPLPTDCAYAPPGEYVKDHTLIFVDGWWHLYSISGTAGYYHGYTGNEETLSWSISKDLVNWEFRGHIMHPSQRMGTYDQHEIWAPFCIRALDQYFMFYTGIIHPHRPMEYQKLGHSHPWNHHGHVETQGLAVSQDLTDWLKIDNPQTGLGVPGRDTHVVRDETNKRWLLYSTIGTQDEHVAESVDMRHWNSLGICAQFPKTIASSRLGATALGMSEHMNCAESITVMQHPLNQQWIMLANWHYSLSSNPVAFNEMDMREYDRDIDGIPIDMGYACEIIQWNDKWYRSGVFGKRDYWQIGFTEIKWQTNGAFTIARPSILAT